MINAVPQAARKGRKYDQVLEGARSVFMRDGFDGASVDDIARAAGVSKATLYSYFPDKRLLFTEVIKVECIRQADAAEAAVDGDVPVRVMLRIAAERMTAYLISDFGQQMFRIIVAEGARFPGLGAQFYQFGPGLIIERLKHHMQCCLDAGQLTLDDLDLAAEQFAQLCKASIHEKLLFGLADTITPAEVDRIVTGAVDMFMARYGAR